MTHRKRHSTILSLLPICLTIGGCNNWVRTEKQTGPDAVKEAKPETVLSPGVTAGAGRILPSQTGTVGASAYMRYARPMPVRGYGLVIGLDGAGSGKCPQQVADYLQTEIARFQSADSGEIGKISPQQLIKSPHAAAVVVQGEIPAAAVKGTKFDLVVRAVDRDVKSLAGGVLITCNLRLFSPDKPLEGKILAKAGGRVFSNPFTRATSQPADSDPRQGVILGGGMASEDRPVQLISVSPSYATIRQITQVINDRFGSALQIADAVSPTNVTLKIPPSYANRVDRFLQLMLHLSLAEGGAAMDLRTKALADELALSDAPYEETALCLEAIGPAVLPMVQKHYTHRQRATSYFAARVGLRLGDTLALEVVQRHANEANSPYRQAAIRELGEAAAYQKIYPATAALKNLLDDHDTRIRILAYEALRPTRDSCIRPTILGKDNFILDLVDTKGPGLIYARRTGERRIAVFGSGVRCQLPLFYSQPDRPVTIADDQGKIVITRKASSADRKFEPIRTTTSVMDLIIGMGGDAVPDLDNKIQGVALDYGVVLHVLSRLCSDNSIPAMFRMEETDLTDLLGPQEPQIRPESDEL